VCGPGDGFVYYACHDSVNENSIAEGLEGYGFTGWGDNNTVRGGIAIANNGGLFNGTSSATSSQGLNFTLSNFVGINNNGTCIYLRPSSAVVDGVTCLGNQVIADNSITNGLSSFNVTLRNALVQNTSGNSGFYLGQDNGPFTTSLIEYSQAWNTGGFNGGWTLPNPPQNVNPNIGSCIVYVPSTAAFKGKGKAGADIGGNIIYAYQDGTLSSNKLWNSSTGKMNYGPVVVPGINDSSTGLVRDTAGSRLNVATAGCLPAGY
jgi:hypothetical protein